MTAQNIITAALREIMIVRTGQTPSTDESTDGLNSLNRMLANWNTERLVVTFMSRFTGNLIASQQSYTIGTGGNLNTPRPIAIRTANIITAAGGFVKTLELVDEAGWSSRPGRSRQASLPLKLYYQPSYPLGMLFFWPVPNTTPQIELFSWAQLAQFAALGDSFDLQPGFEEAITLNLAIRLASQFDRTPSPALIESAQRAMAAITGVNAPPIPGAAEELEAQPRPTQ